MLSCQLPGGRLTLRLLLLQLLAGPWDLLQQQVFTGQCKNVQRPALGLPSTTRHFGRAEHSQR
jgi:hypothetical protein